MINLAQVDEYGVTYCTDTFLTIEDAKDALYNLECALEDSTSASRSYFLQDLISQLRDQIEQEQFNDEDSN
jgi:hypothetical protein